MVKNEAPTLQFCTRWSIANSLLAMLFSSELQLSRWLLISAIGTVLAVVKVEYTSPDSP